MTDPNTRIIEINGVKFKVDMRTARRVDELRVGTKVNETDYSKADMKFVHYNAKTKDVEIMAAADDMDLDRSNEPELETKNEEAF